MEDDTYGARGYLVGRSLQPLIVHYAEGSGDDINCPHARMLVVMFGRRSPAAVPPLAMGLLNRLGSPPITLGRQTVMD